MGNNLQTCCTDTKDTKNELSRQDVTDGPIAKAKGGNLKSLNAAPYIEQKSLDIFENQEISGIKNHINDNQNSSKNINGNFNSESNLDAFRNTEFKPDEAFISNFLVSRSHNKNVNLDNLICDRINLSRFSKNVTEKFTLDFTQILTQPEFTGDNIIELPAVYLDKEKKNEIYIGSWIIDNKEIQEGEEIKNLNSNMKFHGYGVYIRKDETVQEGVFRYGQLDGPGKTYFNNGDTFIGIYEKGLLNNKGVFIDYAGDIYEGDFKDNVMAGIGQETFIDGSTFKGEYKDNKKNGQGHFVWQDGSVYKGELKDNLFHGYGVYEWSSGLIYKGEWVKGFMEGKGIITTKSGDYYEGEFKNSKKEGFGLFWWNDSKYYLGYWKSGLQHGEGKFLKDGKLMTGIWENGKYKKQLNLSQINFPERNFGKKITFLSN
jgi:hypothetical protein